MTAFEDFVNLELPKRRVLLNFANSGYDGDPNGGGAPAIIANSPVGTWFRELTAAKWWTKTETVWEEGGGGAGDAYSNALIYREGDAASGPVVFGTWPALMAQLALMQAASNGSGMYQIAFDDSMVAPFTGVTIPAAGSPHDMTNVTWVVGDGLDATCFINVADGVTFTKLRKIDGRLLVTSLSVGISPSPVSDFIILDQFSISGGASIFNGGTVPFLSFAGLLPGDFADIYINDVNTGIGGGGVPVIEAGPAGTIISISCEATCGIPLGGITGGAPGSVVLYGGQQNMILGRHPGFLGTFTLSVSNIGPMGVVKPVPPLVAAIAPFTAFFGDTIQRFNVSGGAVAQALPALPSAGGQEGGSARQITIVEESGTAGLTVAPAGGDTINGVAAAFPIPAGGAVTFLGDGESNWYAQSVYDPLRIQRVDTALVSGTPDGLVVGRIARYDSTAGNIVSNLPPASSVDNGHEAIAKNEAGVNNVNVTPSGADTIDGVAAFFALVPGASAQFVSNGISNWTRI